VEDRVVTPDEIMFTAHRDGRLTRAEWKVVEMAESESRAETLKDWREMFRLGLRRSGIRDPYASETADFLTGWCAEKILFGQVSTGRPACPCGALPGEEHEHRDAEPVA
jgi:hypothetical protein